MNRTGTEDGLPWKFGTISGRIKHSLNFDHPPIANSSIICLYSLRWKLRLTLYYILLPKTKLKHMFSSKWVTNRSGVFSYATALHQTLFPFSRGVCSTSTQDVIRLSDDMLRYADNHSHIHPQLMRSASPLNHATHHLSLPNKFWYILAFYWLSFKLFS